MESPLTILGIESSCDETSTAVIEVDKKGPLVLSNIVASQVNLHRRYGGVFPELASRIHLENIIPCLKTSLRQAKRKLKDIDVIAVTTGPGLIGSLLVGVNTAKTIAWLGNKKIVPVNHLEGHIWANFINQRSVFFWQELRKKIPFVALVVSGGHTLLVLSRELNKYQLLGETKDDAAGEAFDKVAALLGLTYPGGPAIEKSAQRVNQKHPGQTKETIKLPRPMLYSKDFNFSFSGLKTAVLYLVKQLGDERIKYVKQELAYQFQEAVIEVLVKKTIRAALKHRVRSVLLCGGVAANKTLRTRLEEAVEKLNPPVLFSAPPIEFCTDNAAMIALAAYPKLLKEQPLKWYHIFADANLKLA